MDGRVSAYASVRSRPCFTIFQILEDFILPCKKMLSSAHESINALCIDDSGQMFYRILHIYDSFRYELSPCGFWKYLFETTDSRIKTGSSKKGTLANIIILNIISKHNNIKHNNIKFVPKFNLKSKCFSNKYLHKCPEKSISICDYILFLTSLGMFVCYKWLCDT